MTSTDDGSKTVQFSIVSAIYNVARYLPEFLSSLERQSYGLANLDVVLVDDGSTDSSLELLHRFAARHPQSVRVFSQANNGQGSARNFGLGRVTGEWITFVDPDDFLADNYFASVAKFLSDHPGEQTPSLATAALTSYYEDTGQFKSDHLTQKKFAYGSRIVNLDVEADAIQLHCNCAFFQVHLIQEFGLRFDERIRPIFEDANFVANYLLRLATARLGLIADAEYFYRKRTDNSSSVATSASHPGRYTVVPEFGYLALLTRSAETKGLIPEWLQHTILYDIAWAMKEDAKIESATGAISDDVRAQFHMLLSKIMPHISRDVVTSFSITHLNDDLRFALLHGYSPDVPSVTPIQQQSADLKQGITKFSYRYTGQAPIEDFYADGVPVAPVYEKRRAIVFHGRSLATERIVWVPMGNRNWVRLNGKSAFIENGPLLRQNKVERSTVLSRASRLELGRPEYVRHPAESLVSLFRTRAGEARRRLTWPTLRDQTKNKVLSALLHSSWGRRAFLDSWVFMDKDVLAGDNAEHLYRYVRDNHPEIKAWFVLNRTSPDWPRLKADGFNLIAYRSRRWRVLMLSAAHFASSHIDQYVIRPLGRAYGTPRWRFTFLQHGVTKDDLSRWLNTKQIDLFATASNAEYQSIAGDATPYVFSEREVRLTGFPRHDGLLARRAAVAEQDRDLLLVMPTWRKNLVGEKLSSANEREKMTGFMETEYARQYTELLHSPRLLRLAQEHHLTIAFMPHPNMVRYLPDFNLPSQIKVFSFEDTPVQDILARGRLLISDYSSLAFEAALIDVPTIHFQFDRDEFFKGGHIGRKGYFDYERDGFGPVCVTRVEVEDAASHLLGLTGNADYLRRMRETFAHHDQLSSQRVFEAMRALDDPAPGRPLPLTERSPTFTAAPRSNPLTAY